MGRIAAVGMILLLLLFNPTPVLARSAAASDIATQLVCQCGCTLVLENCNHVGCSSREEMFASIEQGLASGQSSEQIIQLFVTRYGEQVLSAPPKSDFNLLVWVLPGVAIVSGAGLVYLLARRWVGRSKVYAAGPVAAEDETEYRQKLEQELKDFSGGSFR